MNRHSRQVLGIILTLLLFICLGIALRVGRKEFSIYVLAAVITLALLGLVVLISRKKNHRDPR
ncbi:hypothetical protein ABB02_00020 [Clostridiaceae bacterium JG1575]|nr:hypothetical protein ABB02_00020 [Clostridiaceae bacterium JG1575]